MWQLIRINSYRRRTMNCVIGRLIMTKQYYLGGGVASIIFASSQGRAGGGGRGVTKENKSNVVLVEPNPM